MTRVDTAFVIGAALSLSSSAFVLKILQEKGQLQDNVGRASLGVLLLQVQYFAHSTEVDTFFRQIDG